MDHKQLPLLVLPPKSKALAPWLTTVVDDGTRALLGWTIATAPTSGTVLTAMRMALTHEPLAVRRGARALGTDRGPAATTGDAGQPFLAFVDFAHNTGGQHRLLPFLRSLTDGRV